MTPLSATEVLARFRRSMELRRDVVGALAQANSYLPLFSAIVFRSAILWKFSDERDVRAVTKCVAAARLLLPTDYRHLMAPREGEAFIRCQLTGDSRWLPEDRLGSEPLVYACLMVNRFICEEISASPSAVAEIFRSVHSLIREFLDLPPSLRSQLIRAFRLSELSAGELKQQLAGLREAADVVLTQG